MGYCYSCGSSVPDGQSSCSMCFGDIAYGTDGYYEQFMRDRMAENIQEPEPDNNLPF